MTKSNADNRAEVEKRLGSFGSVISLPDAGHLVGSPLNAVILVVVYWLISLVLDTYDTPSSLMYVALRSSNCKMHYERASSYEPFLSLGQALEPMLIEIHEIGLREHSTAAKL